jgi:hypothetical protein
MQSSSYLRFQLLDVYVAAKEFVRRVHAAKIRDKVLRCARPPRESMSP